jgi:formylglycine-generating enzyme required for sulfatase activity
MSVVNRRSAEDRTSDKRPLNHIRALFWSPFMNRILASLILLFAIFFFALQSASAVTIAWTPVGNPGNAPDTVVMTDGSTGYGSVPYAYKIGTYDVTNSQYVAFLNSNDSTGADPLGLYNGNMSSAPYGGINYNPGAANGSKYSVISGDGNHPVNYVTWYDAIRFANWLNNGQVPGSTETGAYTLLGGTPTPSNGNSITRNPGATVFLPSENEWYKAAYYNPATGSYFQYPTSNNTAPTAEAPPGGSNSANYNSVVGNLTDVGAYTATTSPYGAFDMGGNVNQWNEGVILISGVSRGLRGGSFNGDSSFLLSSGRDSGTPSFGLDNFGFRVASVPEPSTGVLVVAACGLMWVLRKRFK